MTTTTLDGFGTATQAGSFTSWTSLSNLTAGSNPAICSLKASGTRSNTISLSIPDAMTSIPSNSRWDGMVVFVDLKKEAGNPSKGPVASTINYYTKASLGSAAVPTFSGFSADSTYDTKRTDAYDPGVATWRGAAFWGIDAYSGDEIMALLRNGGLKIEFWVEQNVTGITDVYLRNAQIQIDYTELGGRRASIIRALA